MADKIHDREMVWGSYKGGIQVKDMTDIHVINVVHLLTIRINKQKDKIKELNEEENEFDLTLADYTALYLDKLEALTKKVNNFKAEMGHRNIPISKLDDAPYPFIDEKGCERLWDEENKVFNIRSPSVRFAKDD